MNTDTIASNRTNHPVASRDAWLDQRHALLAREKALTHLRDEIARERRALPWVRLDKTYTFDTPHGPRALGELFDGRRQLMVQHFMFAPGWQQGCKSCSFMTDHLGGAQIHLQQRDVTVLLVSRAPLGEIEAFRQRMGWDLRWVSASNNDFNLDFQVSFPTEGRVDGEVVYNYGKVAFPQDDAPGISFFYKDDAGDVFHSYSTFGRGVEVMMGTYDLLDLAPGGRGEDTDAHGMQWVRHHDRYDAAPAPAAAASCCASRG